jgi:hypothetical protein
MVKNQFEKSGRDGGKNTKISGKRVSCEVINLSEMR